MLADGNPAELFEAKGEALWKSKRGPKNASLEACDLGKGPGVVKGAFVELPRYFADTGAVQDLESRLLSCMETLQGFNAAEIAGDAVRPRRAGQHGGAGRLRLGRIARHEVQPAAGARRRTQDATRSASGCSSSAAAPYDFACASCHGEDGKRIRLQDLPNLTKNPGDGVGFAAWPAYRVSQRRAVGHAAAAQRLLPPAALSVPGLRLGRDRSRSASTWASTPRAPSRSRRRSSAEPGAHDERQRPFAVACRRRWSCSIAGCAAPPSPRRARRGDAGR